MNIKLLLFILLFCSITRIKAEYHYETIEELVPKEFFFLINFNIPHLKYLNINLFVMEIPILKQKIYLFKYMIKIMFKISLYFIMIIILVLNRMKMVIL